MKTTNEVKVEKAYFRGNERFGRTTKLVCAKTGAVLLEVMGVVPKGELLAQYNRNAK